MNGAGKVERRIWVPVGPDELWEELARPDEWLGARVEWELLPGMPATFEEADGRRLAGHVVEVRWAELLRFTWAPEDGEGPASEVTWSVRPEGDGSELTVTERRLVPATTARAAAGRAAPAHAAAAYGAAEALAQTWSPWDARMLCLWGLIGVTVVA